MNPASLVGHLLELVQETDSQREPADRSVSRFFRQRKYLGSHDRRFLSDTLFGIIRHRRLLEALLEEYTLQHPEAADLDTPRVRYLPLALTYELLAPEEENRSGWYLLFWKTYFPKLDPQEFVQWVTGHTNLEFLSFDETLRMAVRHSFQDWMVSSFRRDLSRETENLLVALNAPSSTTLRVNTLKTDRESCRSRLASEGTETIETQHSPAGLVSKKRFSVPLSAAFKEGWFELQDEGSQLISILSGVEPGWRVIDACAGAGGKSLHLAALMANRGDVLAVDVESRRLAELSERAGRAGVQIIRTSLRQDIRWEDVTGSSDLVLVDAPCSGSGTIRRNPWLKWSIREEAVKNYSSRQLDILISSSQAVKPGGKLVYATCSLFREENEDVVREFLRERPDFSPARAPDGAGSLHIPGQAKPFLTLYPHRYGGDGYFIALLSRAG